MHYLRLTAVGLVCALSEVISHHSAKVFSSGHRVIENDAQPKLAVHIADAIHNLSCNRNLLSGSCVIANSTIEQLRKTSPAMPTSIPLKNSLLP